MVVEFLEVLVAGSRSFYLLELVTTPRLELVCALSRNEKQILEVIHLCHDDGLLFSLFYILDNR